MGRPVRDQYSLKKTFDKFVTAKKTGGPDFPEKVKRAKNLQRDILRICVAADLGGESNSVILQIFY